MKAIFDLTGLLYEQRIEGNKRVWRLSCFSHVV